MPSRLNITSVLFARIHTKGAAMRERKYIGRATAFEAFSARLSPMRFGTSSPKMMVR